MSSDMTLRLVLLGVLAAILLIGFAMSDDSYIKPRRDRSDDQPEPLPHSPWVSDGMHFSNADGMETAELAEAHVRERLALHQ